MTTLTLNQQDLINQIISEFIQHNEASERTKTKSLLGVDEIMQSVHRKKKEILRIKAHNEAVFKAVEPIFDENFDALYQEFDALGLYLTKKSEWYTSQDGSYGTSMKVSLHLDRNSDSDIYINVSVSGAHLKFEEETLWNVRTLVPLVNYSFNNAYHTFEDLCQHPKLRSQIKSMYETKNK
jgi:hypothetical protein